MNTNTNTESLLASIALASREQDITLSLKLGRQLYRWLKGKDGCEVLDDAGLDVDDCIFDFTRVEKKVRLSAQPYSPKPWERDYEAELDADIAPSWDGGPVKVIRDSKEDQAYYAKAYKESQEDGTSAIYGKLNTFG